MKYYGKECYPMVDRICPICNNSFLPAPYHRYKDKRDDKTLVCSNSCMRESARQSATKVKKVRGKMSKRCYSVDRNGKRTEYMSVKEAAGAINRSEFTVRSYIKGTVRPLDRKKWGYC